jgi:hypothetical protein
MLPARDGARSDPVVLAFPSPPGLIQINRGRSVEAHLAADFDKVYRGKKASP